MIDAPLRVIPLAAAHDRTTFDSGQKPSPGCGSAGAAIRGQAAARVKDGAAARLRLPRFRGLSPITALNNISQIFKARGDYETALTYLKQSLAIQQEIGDSAGLCPTLFNMGHIHWQNGEQAEALAAWVMVYRLAHSMNLTQALDALEGLAGQLSLPGGLDGWEALAQQMDGPGCGGPESS